MSEKKVEARAGLGCDVSMHQGFISKRNKQSIKLLDGPGDTLVYNTTDAAGNIKSREFTVGQGVRIVRGLAPQEEINEEQLDLDKLPVGRIEGFWTCIDNGDAAATGAEIKVSYYKLRLPLRCLLPLELPDARD